MDDCAFPIDGIIVVATAKGKAVAGITQLGGMTTFFTMVEPPKPKPVLQLAGAPPKLDFVVQVGWNSEASR